MNNLKRFKDFSLQVKARIWPRLSCMCHIRSTVDNVFARQVSTSTVSVGVMGMMGSNPLYHRDD